MVILKIFKMTGLILFVVSIFFTASSYSQSLLKADCSNSDAYGQITGAGYGLETPDCGHPVKHITVQGDATVGCAFAFTIHRDLDDDRCTNTDRQRLEIKMNDSNSKLGTTRTHQWKFKLDAAYQCPTHFCHIHQIKADGTGDIGSPIITLTTRKGTPDALQFIYTAPSGKSGSGTLTSVDLTPFKGNWVQVTEHITYANPAKYSIKIIRLSDAKVLLDYTNNTMNFDRGASFYRPKYGIYRSILDKENLRDETVLFADFCYSTSSSSCYGDPIGSQAPAAPSNLAASAASSSQINLTWTDNSNNETAFHLERSTDGGSTWSSLTSVGANVTGYSNTGLAASTAYSYHVRAENAAGNSTYSNTASATTSGTSPIAPSGLIATSASSSQINLTWTDNSNNETAFHLERSSDGGSTWSSLISVGANVTSYSNTGLAASTTYSYHVRAENAAGNSAYSSTASATTQASGGGTDNIWLEGEAGAISSPMAISTDANASGGKYIAAPSGTNSTGSAPSSGYSTISFTAGGGNYKLWFRTIMPTTSTNSFYYRIDGGSWVTYSDNNAVSSAWQWNTVTVSVSISAGTHTITIAYREGGSELDKVLLTTDAAYVPTGLGGNITYDNIGIEAEAGTITSPMAISNDANASGGKYIAAPNGTNSTGSAPSSGYSTLSFTAAGGSYKLWFRTIMPTTGTNSFWYRIDGGSWTSWNVDADVSTAWLWNSVATLSLSAGSHALTIAYREGGAELDKIILTTNQSSTPTGTGSSIAKVTGQVREAVAETDAMDAKSVAAVPVGYYLGNNPNPFNPSTIISYSMPEAGQVRLAIYDISGREVTTLVDGFQSAGMHQATWDASTVRSRQLSSGTYLARMTAGAFTQTIKLMLMK